MKKSIAGYSIIVLFIFLPLIIVGMVQFYAETILGLDLSDRGVTNCGDICEEAKSKFNCFFRVGWFFVLTLPIGSIALLVWTFFVFRKK